MPERQVNDLINNRYRLLKFIGGGGMGVVFKALDTRYEGRPTALKLLHSTLGSESNAHKLLLRRFEQEVWVTARLGEHPLIVSVFDSGIDQNQPYLVMEYYGDPPLLGSSLADLISREGAFSLERAFPLIKQICAGLHFAHTCELKIDEKLISGVVHRDIKPSNIFVIKDSALGETIRLLDFGISKALSDITITLGTQLLGFIGTARYAAPEQLRGKSLDPRADIYSLGVVIYEMLTGDLPFHPDTDSFPGWYQAHNYQQPRRFDDLASHHHVPKSAQDIVLACLEKNPLHRPQTMQELSLSLEEVLGSMTPLPPSLPLADPALSTLTAVPKPERPLAPPPEEPTVRTANGQPAEEDYWQILQELADNPWQDSSHTPTLVGQVPEILTADYPPVISKTDVVLPPLPAADPLTPSSQPIRQRDPSETEGSQPVTALPFPLGLPRVPLAEAQSTPKKMFWHQQFKSLAFAASAFLDGKASPLIKSFVNHSGWVLAVAFSPDGELLATGSEDATVTLRQMTTGKVVATLTGHAGKVNSLAFSPDGRLLATASEDTTIKLWDVTTYKLLHTLSGHQSQVKTLTFSPLQNIYLQKDQARRSRYLLASSGDDRVVKVWDLSSLEAIFALEGHTSVVNSLSFNSDGLSSLLLASGSGDGTIKVWNLITGSLLRTFKDQSGVWSVAFSPLRVTPLPGRAETSKTVLASGHEGKQIRLWDVVTGQAVHTFSGHTSRIRALAFSPDGLTLVSGSGDTTIKVWDIASGQLRTNLTQHKFGVWSVAFNPCRIASPISPRAYGYVFASGSGDSCANLWWMNGR
ncbi:MAG: protein kinase [Cyanobacteriota bacterium]|nr:protein kinase [Cyanobacteriota bacterium]